MRYEIIRGEHTKTKLLQRKENIFDMENTIQKMMTDTESSKNISFILAIIIVILTPFCVFIFFM